jgi:hypothetical protein
VTHLLWLADVLRDTGLQVREIPGWETLGHGAVGEILGVLCHHTAGPATGNFPSERVVVNGRTGLAGPLANLGLARDGTWVVVAAGQAWHAGTGAAPWCPRDQGNSHLIGVEAESTGRGDWTAAQREAYPRGVAALLFHLGLGSERAIGHKEWAPHRKIDPAGIDMTAFRAAVVRYLKPARFTAPEESDLTPEQAQQLATLYSQMVVGPDLQTTDPWGWDTFGGGTDEVLTAVDFLRRANVQLEDVKKRLAAIETGKSGPPVLSDADVARIAAETIRLLGVKTST